MNRASKRQLAERKNGTRSLRVASTRLHPTPTDLVKSKLNLISVDEAKESDFPTIMALKGIFAQEKGETFTAMNPVARFIVARNRITSEVLACISMMATPQGMILEDFFAVPGRMGKLAARAILERFKSVDCAKYAVVADEAMLAVLVEHYGYSVVGKLVRSP